METTAESARMPIIMHKPAVAAVQSTSFEDASFGNVNWQTLLSSPTTKSDSMCVGIAVCPANGSLELHQHAQAEVYYILAGAGEVEIDGQRHRVTE
ncbi:hypothetical protein Micbo1qcDRAFT_155043, partial [Microdochium bolleyi]